MRKAGDQFVEHDDVWKMAVEIFGTHDAAAEWMTGQNLALGNRTPADLLAINGGSEIVRMVLNAISTGGVV